MDAYPVTNGKHPCNAIAHCLSVHCIREVVIRSIHTSVPSRSGLGVGLQLFIIGQGEGQARLIAIAGNEDEPEEEKPRRKRAA
jgi:hypothetical protein